MCLHTNSFCYENYIGKKNRPGRSTKRGPLYEAGGSTYEAGLGRPVGGPHGGRLRSHQPTVASSRHTGSIARRHQSKAPACCRPRACTRQLAGALPIWSGVGRPDQFEAHSGTRPRPRPPHRVEGAARLAARLRGKEVRSNLGIKIDLGRAALRTSSLA